MAVHTFQEVRLSALGMLVALLWTVQIAADWFLPHSDIGIAELDKIELANAIQTESSDSSRVLRLESKSDPDVTIAGALAACPVRTDRSLTAFPAENSHRDLVVALPGIRAPPLYFSA